MRVQLYKCTNGEVCLSIGDKRLTRVYLSEEEAQHLSNRLQSYAKGQHAGIETINPRGNQS